MSKNGILMAISSLPSGYGIGDLGPGAYSFVDYLVETGVNIWQILPFNRLGYGNSPYQTASSIAGDEIYISIDNLVEDGYLALRETAHFDEDVTRVDYDAVRRFKEPYLRKAFAHFQEDFPQYERAYQTFLVENPWAYNYSVFLALKDANNLTCWTEWIPEHRDWIKTRDLDLTPFENDMAYYQFLQFIFFGQWDRLKYYANASGIEIMGDLPYYVGIDSLDVWENQQCFLLDQDGQPTYVAGVPPDYFNENGQRWGNPIYNWEALQEDGFHFWIERLRLNMNVFDSIRLDHFRAFDTYWKIAAEEETAIVGEWIEAPGYAFFDALFQALPEINIVVEDLGDLRPEVLALRDHYGFTGMAIMQFSFDKKRLLPPRKAFGENTIAYTGTHDNQTTLGWFLDLKEADQKRVKNYLKRHGYKGDISEQMIQCILDSGANVAIVPVWDILGLDDGARMNTPSTIGPPNWEWKLADYDLFEEKLESYAKWLVEYRVSPRQ